MYDSDSKKKNKHSIIFFTDLQFIGSRNILEGKTSDKTKQNGLASARMHSSAIN